MSMAYGDDDFMPEIPIEDLATAAREIGIDLNSREGADEVMGAKITRWRDMPDEDAPKAWDELREFVEWIVTRYELTDNIVPPCWYRHSPLVEELSALRAAWDASFVVETDGGLGPIGWHERFSLAQQRFKEHYRGECKRGNSGHVETPVVTLEISEDEWNKWKETA